MPPYISGAKDTYSNANDKLVDMRNFLDYIRADDMDTALLRRWGINGDEAAKSVKTEWEQTMLRTRGEIITLADAIGVTVTVADSKVYQVNELIRCEAEVMRVGALASPTTLTVVRGYNGTAALHTAKLAYSLGTNDPENALAGAAVADTPTKLFNYTQNFSVPVEMSNDQIMALQVDGNGMDDQLERRFIEINRQLSRSVLYGIAKDDPTNKTRQMAGVFSFLTSNVTSVGGANTIAAIDALILKIVNAGAKPTTIGVSPFQKQKLDALDVNKQFLGKKEHTGGNLITQSWQSGILTDPLEIVVDRSLMDDQLLITDDSYIKPIPYEGNGLSGRWGTFNAAANGQDGKKQVIRGKYSLKVHNEKAHGYLYGLT